MRWPWQAEQDEHTAPGSAPVPEVLIVGAGPTGLTLGIRLRQQGVACRIIERLPAPLPWSRALGLHARTQELLAALGVLDAVRERSLGLQAVNVYGERDHLFRLDLDALDAPYPQVLSCPQATVEELLTERFLALGGVLERGVELTGFQQQADHVVALLRDENGERRCRASVLVGCDGAGSQVRQQAGISFDGVRYADHFLLADVALDWPLSPSCTHGFLRAEGALIAIPMPDRWRLIINLADDEDLSPVTDAMPIQQRLERYMPAARIDAVHWVSRFSIHRRLAGRYRLNRVFLAGDACHIQSPLGAQGMNTGIADAFNLAWKLGHYLQGWGGGRLLDSYEQERRPVAAQMLQQVDLLSRGSFSRAAWVRQGRELTLRWLSRQPALARRLLRRASQLDVHYRQSPQVSGRGNQRPGPKPGDRMPDALLVRARHSGEDALHRWLLDPRWHLVIQLPQQPDHPDFLTLYALVSRLVESTSAQLRLHCVVSGRWPAALNDLTTSDVQCWQDTHGHWLRQYGEQGQLWLMRPDGHLGFRAPLTDSDQLLLWLARLWQRD